MLTRAKTKSLSAENTSRQEVRLSLLCSDPGRARSPGGPLCRGSTLTPHALTFGSPAQGGGQDRVLEALPREHFCAQDHDENEQERPAERRHVGEKQ